MAEETHDLHTEVLHPSYGRVVLAWEGMAHEPLELGPRARIVVTVLLILIIGYALLSNSPLMAVTFILIGVLGYLLQHHPGRLQTFAVTTKGIISGRQFYLYENVYSFSLSDEIPYQDLLSLHTKSKLLPFIHIPIETVDRETLRETLLTFIPERKHDPTLVDMLERFLHI